MSEQIYIFNPEHDLCIANGDENFVPQGLPWDLLKRTWICPEISSGPTSNAARLSHGDGMNHEGVRFANEMLTRDKLSEAILAQTKKSAFIIFDQSVRESLAAIENYSQQGLLTTAASASELAHKLKLPVLSFVETMNKYQEYQTTGEDLEFDRNANEMPRPLTQPPLYAIEIEPVLHNTMGGIKINSKAEVVNSNGNSVPGLYAAGEVTGGVHGGNRLGGNAVTDIIVFGKIAGSSAVHYINQSLE